MIMQRKDGIFNTDMVLMCHDHRTVVNVLNSLLI